MTVLIGAGIGLLVAIVWLIDLGRARPQASERLSMVWACIFRGAIIGAIALIFIH